MLATANPNTTTRADECILNMQCKMSVVVNSICESGGERYLYVSKLLHHYNEEAQGFTDLSTMNYSTIN